MAHCSPLPFSADALDGVQLEEVHSTINLIGNA